MVEVHKPLFGGRHMDEDNRGGGKMLTLTSISIGIL
jgi:hypothetical protein